MIQSYKLAPNGYEWSYHSKDNGIDRKPPLLQLHFHLHLDYKTQVKVTKIVVKYFL
jgi:hypothetical protein